MSFYSFYGNVIKKRSGNKNALGLRAFNANQVIYGANSSFDDDVKYDKDSVEYTEVALISELNTGLSIKENLFPQISHKDIIKTFTGKE